MTGDQGDILARLKALLPNGWFRDQTPVLDAVLAGIAAALAQLYGLIAYARRQTRVLTATDGFLDVISLDFFGGTLPRKTLESDAAFRRRILAQLLLEKGTRQGMIKALILLTGRTPLIFEPGRPQDAGTYSSGKAAYNTAGAYGSVELPYQIFITAYRPTAQVTSNRRGYNNANAAYNEKSTFYTSLAELAASVTDQDIYDMIAAVKPEGTVAWVRILN